MNKSIAVWLLLVVWMIGVQAGIAAENYIYAYSKEGGKIAYVINGKGVGFEGLGDALLDQTKNTDKEKKPINLYIVLEDDVRIREIAQIRGLVDKIGSFKYKCFIYSKIGKKIVEIDTVGIARYEKWLDDEISKVR